MTNNGSAYYRPEPTYFAELTQVGRGTPMGELLRRYWHPIGLAADATATPRTVRVLNEDLILFRDGKGRPGLVHPRCAHRGASLYYGRVEEAGIRCCYHGWLFDTEGNCLEQPCEPDMGAQTRGHVRQPHYPLEERYGLIFAYMGPPERKPVLPRYEVLENLAEGEFLETDDSSIGSGGPVIVDCNWLQHYENVLDPFHVPILHGSFSGDQFNAKMSLMPRVTFHYTPRGVSSLQLRDLEAGEHQRITEAVVPTIRAVASPVATVDGPCSLLGWVLPIDDTSFRIYSVGRVSEAGTLAKIRSKYAGKYWHELTEAEHQKLPGDYEAQVGQGAITYHSEENLTSTDQGIGMLRRILRRQVDAVASGNDPMGVAFDAEAALVRLDAGSRVVPKEA
ncbi:phenoxybenzoate dioxygenase [Youhaiella tibetensis]|uniref:Aromatic ring-hydroxylating dioxygenase subunit alpha n=1 Tax=Paradevosia tibetensis TaxID=1447062 RepID=A0A5B9DI02_9HYPH|nr:aromatic ring-hydroxylating dioxygenase subunit alpha [Youhaiella tibetensis]QEE18707.1 aromatic ring-hydroxylating dioxygenase subunit alpha [Youhaiella tibetensis]GGF39958.1 phenoxybenzoate dioxygenase [Youhaiella tibetensis]